MEKNFEKYSKHSSDTPPNIKEETLSLLSRQQSEIQRIRKEEERKEQTIIQLRQHIDDLLRYKQLNIKLKSENRLLKHQIEQKDADLTKASQKIIRYEDDEESRRESVLEQSTLTQREQEESRKKILELNIKLKAVLDDFKSTLQTNKELKNKVHELQGQIDDARMLQQKTEMEYAEMTEKMGSERDRIENEVKMKYKENDELNEKLTQKNNEVAKKNEKINMLLKERSDDENEKIKTARFIEKLQHKCNEIEEKLHLLQDEAKKVPQLEREVEIIPQLQDDYKRAKEEIIKAKHVLNEQKKHNERLLEENNRLSQYSAELEKSVGDIEKKNLKLVESVESLRGVIKMHEIKTNENDELQERINGIKRELQKVKNSYEIAKKEFEMERDVMKNDGMGIEKNVNAISNAINEVLKGNDMYHEIYLPSISFSNRPLVSNSMIITIKKQIENLFRKLHNIKNNKDQFNMQINKKNEQMDGLIKKLEKCRNVMKIQNDNEKKLQNDFFTIKKAFEQLKNEKNEISSDLKEARLFLNPLFDKLMRNKDDSDDMKSDVMIDMKGLPWDEFKAIFAEEFLKLLLAKNELKQERYKRKLAEKQLEISNYEVKKLKTSITKKGSNMNNIKYEKEKLEEEKKMSDVKIRNLEDMLVHNKREKNEIERELSGKESEIKEIERSKNKYKSMLEELNNKYIMSPHSKYVNKSELSSNSSSSSSVNSNKNNIKAKRQWVEKDMEVESNSSDDDDVYDSNKSSRVNMLSPIVRRKSGGGGKSNSVYVIGKGKRDSYSSGVDKLNTSLVPLLSDLESSKELVERIQKVNTKGIKGLKVLDNELEKTRKSMDKLHSSVKYASPKARKVRRANRGRNERLSKSMKLYGRNVGGKGSKLGKKKGKKLKSSTERRWI